MARKKTLLDDPMALPEEAKPATPKKGKVEKDIELSAATYVLVRGYRWESCNGFLLWSRTNAPGKRTRPEWDQLWDAYRGRPVK